MFSRVFTGLTCAGVSMATGFCYYYSKSESNLPVNPPNMLRNFFVAANCASVPTHTQPPPMWDENWDGRSNVQQANPPACVSPANSAEDKSRRVARNIILIRHGEYTYFSDSDEKCKLTELGREQARETAERLIELNIPVSRFIQSSMTRAQETAQIIYKYMAASKSLNPNPSSPSSPSLSSLSSSSSFSPDQLKSMPAIEQFDELREGWPCLAVPHYHSSHSNWPSDSLTPERLRDADRIERAYQLLFYRPPAEQSSETYEIVVCHANVIRYFLCRALQLDAHAWLRFALHHGSISWVRINKRGRVSVLAVGDAGHIPAEKLSLETKFADTKATPLPPTNLPPNSPHRTSSTPEKLPTTTPQTKVTATANEKSR